jgi:hypothetical protein
MEKITYMTSIIFFWLKGSIYQEQNFVKFKIPNTILGIIPVGSKKETIPVNQLSVVETNFKLKLGRLIIGIIVVFLSLTCFADISTNGASMFLAGLIVLIIGAAIVISAFETTLTVKVTSGDKKVISFFVFQKKVAEKAEANINQLISNRMDDTNNRQQTDRIVEAINNK